MSVLFKQLIKGLMPERALALLKRARWRYLNRKLERLPLLEEDEFIDILRTQLRISSGDTVFVHSDLTRLRAAFSSLRVLELLQEAVGPSGTLVFPTHIADRAEDYLKTNPTFNILETPSRT